MVFISGEVKYELLNPDQVFIDDLIITPGQPLMVDDLLIANCSSVESQLRVAIVLRISSLSKALNYQLSTFTGGVIEGRLGDNWQYIESEELNPTGFTPSGYWYYGGIDYVINPAPIEEQPIPFVLLSMVTLNGHLIGTINALQQVQLIINFQAKQAAYAQWIDIGDMVFTFDE